MTDFPQDNLSVSPALHALIFGRVQGVGFRMFVLRISSDLQLTGWVRNLDDGRVEVWAEGDRESLDKLVAKLWQGPPASMVTQVEMNWESPTGSYKTFFMRSTAY